VDPKFNYSVSQQSGCVITLISSLENCSLLEVLNTSVCCRY